MDQCEHCAYYIYNDVTDQYECEAFDALDEDDIAHFGDRGRNCPGFRFYDEYKIVQKQN